MQKLLHIMYELLPLIEALCYCASNFTFTLNYHIPIHNPSVHCPKTSSELEL